MIRRSSDFSQTPDAYSGNEKQPLRQQVAHEVIRIRGHINKVLSYLSERTMPAVHVQHMLQFKNEKNELGRLTLLRSMDMADAIECVQLCCSEVARTYLEQRIALYDQHIPFNEHYEHNEQEMVRQDLWRDILYASTLTEDETNNNSFGQDAIDLEYHFNAEESPHRGIIDWLAHVSAVDIAEAKSAINEGVLDEEVLARVVIKLIGVEKDPLAPNVVLHLVHFAANDPSMRQKLEKVIKIGSALKASSHQLPTFDLMTLANDGPMDLLESKVDNDERSAILDVVNMHQNRPVSHGSLVLMAA